jgi:hypothetical protein
MPTIPVFRRLKQEDQELKVISKTKEKEKKKKTLLEASCWSGENL